MRPFDIAGIVLVAVWIGAVGAFTLWADADDVDRLPMTDGDIELTEETTWMSVYHDVEEVGVLREDRTRLIDGWLVETQGMAKFELMDEPTAFRFTSRTTLDEDLTLQSATGSIEAFGRTLDASGQFRDDDGDDPEFHLDITLDDASQRLVADLERRPRLATHALPEVLADDDLEAGDRYRREFFDPMTFAPTDLEITYEGRDVIDTVEGTYNAHEFLQSVEHLDTRIFTDSQGQVLMQALPMDVVVRRIPDQLGPGRFDDYEEQLEDAIEETPQFVDAIDARDLLSVVARLGAGETDRLRPADDQPADDQPDEHPPDDEPDDRATTFVLEPVDDPDALDLIAPRQHVEVQTTERARVEVGPDNPLWHAGLAPDNPDREPTTEPGDTELFDDLVDALQKALDVDTDDPVDTAAIRQITADHCPDEVLQQPGDVTGDWPGQPVDDIRSYRDCLSVVADGLHALGLSPHFAHGAADDSTRPRVWLTLFVDGHHRGAVDPLADDGRPGPEHLQLYLEDHYSPDRLDRLVDDLQRQ